METGEQPQTQQIAPATATTEVEPVRAVVPAGPGRHWQTIADYLNEDENAEGTVRVTGEPVTLDSDGNVVDGEVISRSEDGPQQPPSPGLFAPLSPMRSSVRGAYLKAAALPTPGGIGPLLFALAVFGMAIIPVGPNGETRLQLLWGTMTGNVTIPGNYQPSALQQLIDSGNPLSGVPIIGGVASGIASTITGDLHSLGWGAGPDGIPGYDASDAGLGGTDGYSRLY